MAEKRGNPEPVLLSGGNPQIAKGDGDIPVKAYVDAMPGWKGEVGRRLDTLIVEAVPDVQKAIRWNTPFYGNKGDGWFVAYHCLTKYIKVSFFKGTDLHPEPPVVSKGPTRSLHIEEGKPWDEEQFTKWVLQASRLPGEKVF
ncbi:DUF1801 domain-containing protein [Mariluticola halotolerans]|uniref:DUF1801 domain-containing protein n=1 Tax=Mariluticola halotolerans TaxID=2909283 RepID=UPI0026E4846E|nr:DUF1801 domain-containing protein [Mariluticola halotolerans]UJQ94446.1 DUF1801 domain-containing protein [Mariluticola halotolerans]